MCAAYNKDGVALLVLVCCFIQITEDTKGSKTESDSVFVGAGRLDDKQGGDTIVTMERVREAIAFNAELADDSTWL